MNFFSSSPTHIPHIPIFLLIGYLLIYRWATDYRPWSGIRLIVGIFSVAYGFFRVLPWVEGLGR